MNRLYYPFLRIFLFCCLTLTGKGQDYSYPFQNTSLTEEERLDNLLSLLTTEEKINLLASDASVPRLHLYGSGNVEGIHGIVLGGPARNPEKYPVVPTTSFPQGYGLGHTWNPQLIREIAAYMSYESRYIFQNPRYQKGGLIVWAPNADLGRDPRWGRTEECYGEDPHLTATLTTAFVRGLQGEHPRYWRCASLLKHFFANSNEYGRTYTSSDFDEQLLREYYTYPFYKGIREGGALAFMTAYNAYNGIPCTVHPLLRDMVMNEWGFEGIIMTDGGAFKLLCDDHHYYPNLDTTAAACVKAGISKFLDHYRPYIVTALNRGWIDESGLNAAVRRNLRVWLKLGLLDHSAENPYSSIGVNDTVAPWTLPSTRQLARKAAQESVVLLKNEGGLLPLQSKSIRKIAVIGSKANEVIADWYGGQPPYTVSVLQGIREALPEAEIRYVSYDWNDSARIAAEWADVAVVCAGNHPWCNAGWARCPVMGEGKEAVDRRSLILDEEDLILTVSRANPRTVAVLISSFPYAINRTETEVPAILHITQSGQELGHAVADVLFGKYNPAGRLTQTWVKSITELPPLLDYDIRHGRTYQYYRGSPLYPFGYGLSYTAFRYSGLQLSSRRLAEGGQLTVSFDLTNTGDYDGEEVVQLYISRKDRPGPVKVLKAFDRVPLRKGETRRIELTLKAEDFSNWDTEAHAFVCRPGKVQLQIGASSADIRLQHMLEIIK